ncbi:MAG TPA: hypothetical protein VJ715_16395 [Pyrinomonadaceae bacterium]|nr:hypothetical protein [Pyrinomonadaceae bacterium]
MKSAQLGQREPHHVVVNGGVEFTPETPRHLRDGRPSVAALPDRRRSLVETVRLVTLQIIDQHLVGQFLNNELIRSGER